MAEENVWFYAVGDIGAFFNHPQSMFEHTAPILKQADIAFFQNERLYTDRFTEAHLLPGVTYTEVTTSDRASALKTGGFHVVSFASNHCLDLGPGAFMDTLDALRQTGMTAIGAGNNMQEARKPAILERKGTRIGILAYNSVVRPGYEAGPNRPGCAPIRVRTFYQQLDYQPATPPVIYSYAFEEDLAAMKEDIRMLRPLVDILVVSMHWGVHNVHAILAMYQREIAHQAIDSGVDLIIGHHPHVLKGIEVYRGKVILYSTGTFAFDRPIALALARDKVKQETSLYKPQYDPEYTEFYRPAEQRISMIVKCRISSKRIDRLSYLPVLINTKAQPVVVAPGEPGFGEALPYMEELCSSQGLATGFSLDGGEIVVNV